ncbi:hypothetical protein LJC10_06385 [Selenomonadales bacterium OttesenSCG-928-I06]|nr:hypothetical protein [Selenomonadales bacterium OttesenSCG-928-I06]
MYHVYTAQPDFKNPPCTCILLVRFSACWLIVSCCSWASPRIRLLVSWGLFKGIKKLLAFMQFLFCSKNSLLRLRALLFRRKNFAGG